MQTNGRPNDQAQPIQRALLLDTCALKDEITRIACSVGVIPEDTVLTVLKGVSRELYSHLTDSDPEKQRAGYQGMLTLVALHSLPHVKLDMDHEEPTAGYADPDLIRRAEAVNGRILTADLDLQAEARRKGVGVISVQDLRHRFQEVAPQLARLFTPSSEISEGQIYQVRIVKQGSRGNDGIGYLDGDRLVVVAEGRFHLNEEVRVRVTHISQNGTIFARIINGTFEHEAVEAQRNGQAQ